MMLSVQNMERNLIIFRRVVRNSDIQPFTMFAMITSAIAESEWSPMCLRHIYSKRCIPGIHWTLGESQRNFTRY